MDFGELNRIARGEFLPTKKIADLKKGRAYMITRLKSAITKVGAKIVAEIDSEFEIFLRKRISDALEKNGKLFNKWLIRQTEWNCW